MFIENWTVLRLTQITIRFKKKSAYYKLQAVYLSCREISIQRTVWFSFIIKMKLSIWFGSRLRAK